jgi:hypothetical protein
MFKTVLEQVELKNHIEKVHTSCITMKFTLKTLN